MSETSRSPLAARSRGSVGRRSLQPPASHPRLQPYAAHSLSELTQRLVKVSKEEKKDTFSSRTRDVVYALKVLKLRHAANAHAFRGDNGVEALLSLLGLCAGREGRDRGLLLSTLANLCALDQQCRAEDPACSSDTLCSVARLLANLALDSSSIPLLHQGGVTRELSHALFCQSGSAPGVQQSVLRALRLLCMHRACREEVRANEGMPAILDCLGVEGEVATSALHTLEVLLQDGDPDAIQLLASRGALRNVVRLWGEGPPEVADRALVILVTCARCSEGRVGLSSTGGVECLLAALDEHTSSSSSSFPLFPAVVGALCSSCRDVLGRQRMRDSGGLERLIHMLADPTFAALHKEIISALVCYYFDEVSLKLMVYKMGLLRALTYHLQLMATRARREAEGEGKEEEWELGGIEEEDMEGIVLACENNNNMAGDVEGSPGRCGTNSLEEVSSNTLPAMGRAGRGEHHPTNSSGEVATISVGGVGGGGGGGLEHSDGSPPSGFSQGTSSLREDTASSASSTSTTSLLREKEEEDNDFVVTAYRSPSYSSPSISPSGPSSPPSLPLRDQPSPYHHSHSSLSSSPSSPSYPSSSADEASFSLPPPKRPRLSSELDFSHPTPANFIDSLLSSPNPYQPQAKLPDPSLATDFKSTLESQVIQLISRVSHLRECLCCLASRDLLLALLDCLLSSPATPNTHIFRSLSRVFANPHCFQECIACLIPSKLYHYIYCSFSYSSTHCWSVDSSPLPGEELDTSLSFQALFSPPCTPRSSLSRRFSSPLTSAPPRCASLSFMCKELQTRLSHVGQSPYGQGVLAHMLLAREKEEKEASILAVPLLCNDLRVCQRIMLDYKGLEALLELTHPSSSSSSSSSSPSSSSPNLKDMASDSLLALARLLASRVDRKRKEERREERKASRQSSSCLDQRELGLWSPFHAGTEQSNDGMEQSHTGMEQSHVCRYMDWDHYPFDFTVVVARGDQTLRLPVHQHILMDASDVFSVMLSGHYIESQSNEVYLRDVDPRAFLSILHHIYGCGWTCPQVHTFTPHTSSQDNVAIESATVTDSSIAAVTEGLDSLKERLCLSHTLHSLATASRFLLDDLCTLCEARAARHISPTIVMAMFNFSQLHRASWLTEECVWCVVVMAPSLGRRCVQELLASPEGPAALDMIRKFISINIASNNL